MRWISAAILLGLAAPPASATPPPPYYKRMAWDAAMRDAQAEIRTCVELGAAAGVFGDVTVKANDRTGALSSSSSKSLGSLGPRIEACLRAALARHLDLHGEEDGLSSYELTERIGRPRPLLPPAATLMPVWRRAVIARQPAARRELARLLPPDYALTRDGCLTTKRAAVQIAEYLWLPGVGSPVPAIWAKPLSKALGLAVHTAIWDPGAATLVVQSDRGLCLLPFDAAHQAALRRDFDTVGACWVGSFNDILLHPRWEFPAGTAYVAIAAYYGRACAVTATGAVTCCGNTEPALPPAPRPVTSIALGYEHACGLDRADAAVCWGKIPPPPPGRFVKLSTAYGHVCGVRGGGELACWGTGNHGVASPSSGAFVDVAAAELASCGVRVDGRVECWGSDSESKHPPGEFTRVAANLGRGCGIRRDRSIGCWDHPGDPVVTPMSGWYKDVVIAGSSICGQRDDDTVACWSNPPHALVPPTNAFVRLAGGADGQLCGVRPNGTAGCWGHVWPGELGDNTWRWPEILGLVGPPPVYLNPPIRLAGRVVDESGAPIAGAEVLVCSDYSPCSDVKSASATQRSTLAQLLGQLGAGHWPADGSALAITDRDGRWSAAIKFRPRMNGEYYSTDRARVVVTAPGRELVEREAHYLDPRPLGGDHVLRPASALDVLAMCGAAPCTGTLSVATGPHRRVDGTHLERLPPGTYTIVLTRNAGQPGERRGTAFVDVPYAAKQLRVAVPLPP